MRLVRLADARAPAAGTEALMARTAALRGLSPLARQQKRPAEPGMAE